MSLTTYTFKGKGAPILIVAEEALGAGGGLVLTRQEAERLLDKLDPTYYQPEIEDGEERTEAKCPKCGGAIVAVRVLVFDRIEKAA